MRETEDHREARLRELASKLFFQAHGQASRFAPVPGCRCGGGGPARRSHARRRRKRSSTHGSFAARTAADAQRVPFELDADATAPSVNFCRRNPGAPGCARQGTTQASPGAPEVGRSISPLALIAFDRPYDDDE
jgi:hypothetical protein